MAKLNFPDPAVTQTYSAAGTTWTWNSTLGVWSAIPGDGFTEADADGRYLKLDASNDPVTGTCEFASDLILDSITSAPALGTDADGKIIATSGGGSSQWTDTTGGIYYNGGNVGVGTDAPQSKFTVKEGAISVTHAANDPGQYGAMFIGNGGVSLAGYKVVACTGNDNARSPRVTIDQAGNVGIGDTDPSEKLEVNGNVKATSFLGNVTGNVTGNVSGSSGSCTGNAATATNADKVDNLHASSFLRSDANDTATGELTLNGKVNFRTGADFADGDYIYMGSSDDFKVSFNNNGWLYVDQNANGIIFRDGGSNKMRLEDSGVFRPETNNTGTIGTSSAKWNNIYATTFTGALSGNASTATTATNCSRSVTGSNGLTGGGQLNGNKTISGVNASTSAKGVVQLSSSTSSTSTSLAATASAAKAAYDRAASYAPSKTGGNASGTWGISISGAVNNSNYNVNNTNTGTVRLMFTGSSYPSVPASNGTGSNGWCFNPGGSAFNNYYNTNSAKTSLWLNRQGNSTGKFIQFRYGAGNLSSTGERGNIRLTDSGNKTAYNTTSDYRLKSNVAPMTDGIDEVKRLKPCTWTWTNNAADGVGFIAHELQEVFPSAVCGEKDATVAIGTLRNSSGEIVAEGIENDEEDFCCYLETDTDENGVSTMEAHTWEQTGERDEFQCVDYGLVTPLLTAALKEAIAKIEDLEGRLAVLEGANE